MSSYPGSMKGRSTGNTVPETGPAGRGAPGMTASKAPQPADAAPAAQRRRRRPAVRRIVHVVLFVALAVGVFGLLPRLGGLTRDAAELRHARPAFVVAAVVAQAISLACYALLYRRVLASLGARLPFWVAARVTMASFLVSHVTPGGHRKRPPHHARWAGSSGSHTGGHHGRLRRTPANGGACRSRLPDCELLAAA